MVKATGIPADSALFECKDKADFYDAFERPIADDSHSALYLYLDITRRTPRWIDCCMTIRNKVMQAFGLKNLGNLVNVPAPSESENLKIGDKVGIFTIKEICEKELLLEIIDGHLDVMLAIYKESAPTPKIKVITVVFIHNWLGRLYMLPVGPIHKIVVRSMLSVKN